MLRCPRRDEPTKFLDVDQPETWYAKQEYRLLARQLRRLSPGDRGRRQGRIVDDLLTKPLTIETAHGPLAFVLYSELAAARALTFIEKQPHTIAWIEGFPSNAVFWDIGANIGTYGLYAARRGCRVVAFEPEAANYAMLAANIEVNQLEDRMQALLVGVSDASGIAQLGVSQFLPGESFSFGDKRGRGETCSQAALTASIDQLVDHGLPCPSHIKIDVPALTRQIIAGGCRTLRRLDVRELHIETAPTGPLVSTLATMGFEPRTGEAAAHDVTFVRARPAE